MGVDYTPWRKRRVASGRRGWARHWRFPLSSLGDIYEILAPIGGSGRVFLGPGLFPIGQMARYGVPVELPTMLHITQ
jgi:hypothetical protein